MPDSPRIMLDAALEWHAAGFSVIRVATDGTKAPLGQWKAYTAERATPEQLTEWFADGHPGMGVVCGAVSGNLEMLEFEGRAASDGTFTAFLAKLDEAGLSNVFASITNGYFELSPSGGIHILYRVEGGVDRNTKLAKDENNETLIETRGENGQVVVYPSHGPVHPSGQPWQRVQGSPAGIVTVTAQQRDVLHAVARGLDRRPAPEPLPETFKRDGLAAGELHPGEDFNERADWREILEPYGWTLVYVRGSQAFWRRPGKRYGVSAVSGSQDGSGRDYLYVYSTSTELPAEESISKWRVYALLNHRGDFSAAAGELRRRGYGSPQPERPSIADIGGVPGLSPGDQQYKFLQTDNDLGHVDLRQYKHDPLPAHLDLPQPERPQGRFGSLLFDRRQLLMLPKPQPLIEETIDLGTVVLLAGNYGSLKSFVVQDWASSIACQQQVTWHGRNVRKHGRILYIASEGAHGLNQRLTAWERANSKELRDETFITLNAKPNLGRYADVAELYDIIGTGGFSVVVIDTLAKCMSGLDENSSKDMGMVLEALYKLRDATGDGTVIGVHHTNKARMVRGSSAIEDGVDTIYMSEGNASGIILSRTKRKDGPTDDSIELRLEPVEGTESAILIPNDMSGSLGELNPNEMAVLNSLKASYDYGWTARGGFVKDTVEELKITRPTVQRAIKRLADKGFVEIDDSGRFHKIRATVLRPVEDDQDESSSQ